MLGFTKNNELFSDMVREEMITMKEALTKLCEADNLQEDILAEFGYQLKAGHFFAILAL